MKRQIIALSLLILLAQTAPAGAADVTVVTIYPGNKGPGWKQTIDVAGAVGPKHVAEANDPRILYDRLSERWFACAAGAPVADCFLAVSTSSDPTRPGKGTKVPLPPIGPYMKMGLDKHGPYICSCNGDSDWHNAMNCYVISKTDVIASGGSVLAHGQTFTKLPMASMPAMEHDPNKAADAPEVLLVNEFSEGTCGNYESL